MRFTLRDAECKKDLTFSKKKKKKEQQYTHIPDEDIPYSKDNFTDFIKTSEDE